MEPFTPRRVDKPWGHEEWFAQTDRYLGKLIHVREGARLSLQYHERKDETMYCLQGNAVIVREAHGVLTETPLVPGTALRIPPGTRHRLVAGIGGCIIIEASTGEADDVIRIEDAYGRL